MPDGTNYGKRRESEGGGLPGRPLGKKPRTPTKNMQVARWVKTKKRNWGGVGRRKPGGRALKKTKGSKTMSTACQKAT